MSCFTNNKLLVPIDFGDTSERAIQTALELATQPYLVHVMHVDPDVSVISPAGTGGDLSEETRGENVHDYFRKTFTADCYRSVQFHVAFGDPGQRITEYAKDLAVGAIIMPSHGRTGLTRILIGSVAERVVRLAPCPVLVLR